MSSSSSISIHACNLCKFGRRPAFQLANRRAIRASVLEEHQHCVSISTGRIFAIRLSVLNDEMISFNANYYSNNESEDCPNKRAVADLKYLNVDEFTFTIEFKPRQAGGGIFHSFWQEVVSVSQSVFDLRIKAPLLPCARWKSIYPKGEFAFIH
ncbi:hypothetical protein T05_8223 [Trichinella murrelli]|uniref:Uncharacterized protein n=1 Tax=Trichinella murrelli TaxID=144512 RepID=A0A0V0TA49_9BILA|nr:hypothetical protein T05_8223 [Trichinella murrelli]